MKIAYFDCFSGAAGDMILGACLDAGMPVEALREPLGRLGVGGFELTAEKTVRKGIACTHARVELTDASPEHRHLKHILAIIDAAELSPRVKQAAAAVFTRLAEAEAAVHGIDAGEVHFHEVGAVDAIVDIVGAAIALEYFQIDAVRCSALGIGSGTVRCAHGILPVPAPATAELLKGVPTQPVGQDGEHLTPTGAAILTTHCAGFGAMPAMTVAHVGYGCGTRAGTARPNVLRVCIGEAVEPASAGGGLYQIETNVDDMTAEQAALAVEKLLGAGARDAWLTPVIMKKGRPGVVISALVGADLLGEAERIFFTDTSTFGLRRRLVERRVLDRESVTVDTPYGAVRVKVGRLDGKVSQVSAEFEDCRKAAEAAGVAVSIVAEAAVAAWRKRPQP